MSLMNDDRREQDAYDRVMEEQRLIGTCLDAAKAAGRSEERQRCHRILMDLWVELQSDNTVARKTLNKLHNAITDIEDGR